MPLDWNVHTPLQPNTWHPTVVDVAPTIDPKTMLATLTLPVIFRGTRAQFLSAFRFGRQNAPHGGLGMFCLGPEDPRQLDYTQLNPHWMATVTWAGIYATLLTGRPGDGTYAFTHITKYTSRETMFPVDVTLAGGSEAIPISPGPPVAPDGNNVEGNPWRGRRLDHVPVRNVRGVIFSSIEPSPVHPAIIAMKAGFLPPPAGVIEHYGWLPDPVFVTWKGGNSAPATNPGLGDKTANWFCREIDTVDRFAPFNAGPAAAAIYVVQAPFSYEQLRQAS